MAIKLPDPGNGIAEDKTGYNEWENMKIVRENFADQNNAASRLVGTATGQIPLAEQIESIALKNVTKDSKTNLLLKTGDAVPENSAASRLVGESAGNVLEVGSFGIGGIRRVYTATTLQTAKDGFIRLSGEHAGVIPNNGYPYHGLNVKDGSGGTVLVLPTSSGGTSVAKMMGYRFVTYSYSGAALVSAEIYTTANVTKDGNGFLKAASPVVDLYDDYIELNTDAEMQGVELIKNGKGDYTLKTKTGLRSDNTWRIEIPHDDNRNPLFAVDIDAKDDGTINIKCYKRIFNMQTFLFEPDLKEPMDITEGRFISVRLNDNPEPEQIDEPAI